MRIRCWGARGSIPVSGPEYVRYGGDTTCIEIRTDAGDLVILDAGSGIRALGNGLLEERPVRCSVIFTHAHWDHLLGFPFFKPLYLADTEIAMYGCPFAQNSARKMLSRVMEAPFFPVNLDAARARITYIDGCVDMPFRVGSLDITPTLLSHPNQGLGYRFTENGKSFVFLTDNELTHRHPGGLGFDDYVRFSAGADLLLHDAEYLPAEYERLTRTWGHSVYTDALRLAMEAGVRQLGLFHHNQDRTDDAIEAMVADCRRTLQERGSRLGCFAAATGIEITL